MFKEMPRGRSKKKTGRKRRSTSAPPCLQSPKKRLKWDEKSMVLAIESIKNGTCRSVKRACEEYDVPRTTLQDRLTGRVQHGVRPGPKPYLNQGEEKDLVNFLEVTSSIGYGKTRKQIKAVVEKTAREKGVLRKQKISDGWFRRFLERQPHLSLCKGDRTAFVRMDAMKNDGSLDNYFMKLKDVLDEHQLMDKPGQIYNVDETGIPLDHRAPRVLTKKGQKKVRYSTSGNKSQITVVGCINAIGQALPPFVIFDAKNLNLEWTTGEVPGTTYGLSDSGWMDMRLFKEWLVQHFLRHVGSSRPILLLLDGHSSHYNLEAVTFAKENDVIMFTLVPHTTHEMQPLDTAVYGPLKANWQDVCHEYIQSHPGRVITKYYFSELFSKAWLRTVVPANIISGFKCCGVYPFNPRAVLDHDPCSADHSTTASQQESSTTETPQDNECTRSGSIDISFTDEEEKLFMVRYREGYDLYDTRYTAWLKVHHPEVEFDTSLSLVDHFPDAVTPEALSITSDTEPNPMVVSSATDVSVSPSSNVNCSGATPVCNDSITPTRLNLPTPRTSVSQTSTSNTDTTTELTLSTGTSSSQQTNVIASVSQSSTPNMDTTSESTPSTSKFSSQQNNAISKYLIQYVPVAPEKKKSSTTRVTGSRVLTSAEGLAILREKEEKKQKEKEDKEKRKQERLSKRKQKEDLAKKKANDKASKASGKSQKKSTTRRSNTSSSRGVRIAGDHSSAGVHISSGEHSSARNDEPPMVDAGVTKDAPTFDTDYECCECLGTYKEDVEMGNGAEWVKCGCGQWIHADCIENTVTDKDGIERFCSKCVV